MGYKEGDSEAINGFDIVFIDLKEYHRLKRKKRDGDMMTLRAL